MNRLWMFGSVGVFLLLAIGGVWYLTLPDAASDPPVPEAEESETEEVHPPREEVSESPEEDAHRSEVVPEPVPQPSVEEVTEAPDSYTRALAGVRGRILEEGGTPLADLPVTLLDFDFPSIFGNQGALFEHGGDAGIEIEAASARTGEDGVFTMKGLHPSTIHGLGIDMGGQRSTLRMIEASVHSGQITDLGDFILPATVTLVGTVVDQEGTPIGGARVRAVELPPMVLNAGFERVRGDTKFVILESGMRAVFEAPRWLAKYEKKLPIPTTYSEEDGVFRLDVPAGVTSLVVDAKGYAGLNKGPIPTGRKGERKVGALPLSTGVTLEAQVLDVAGEPVEGAQVVVGSMSPIGPVAFAEDAQAGETPGSYSAKGFPPNSRYVFAARRDSRTPWVITEPASETQATITLTALRSLTVLLENEKGEPVERAEIRMRPQDLDEAPATFAPFKEYPVQRIEAEKGRVVIEDLALGHYSIVARAENYLSETKRFEITADQEAEIKLVFRPGRQILVEVEDATMGTPIHHAKISVGSGGFGEPPVDEARTDAQGKAMVGPVSVEEGTELRVAVSHPGYANVSVPHSVSEESCKVLLSAGGSVEGRVHFAGHAPDKLHMVVVTKQLQGFLFDMSMLRPRFALTDHEGRFRFTNLTPGEYSYDVYDRFLDKEPVKLLSETIADPFSMSELIDGEFGIVDGQVTQVSIDLSPTALGPTATIRGTVRINGRPGEGAWVQLWGEHRRHRKRATVDANGSFEMTDVTIGSVQISVSQNSDGGDSFNSIHQEGFELKASDIKVVEIDVDTIPARFHVVEKSTGKSVDGAWVMVEPLEENRQGGGHSASTDLDGIASMIVLKPGRYGVQVNHQEKGRSRSEVDIPAGGLAHPWRLELDAGVPCAGRVEVEHEKSEGRDFVVLSVNEIKEEGGGMRESQFLADGKKTFRFVGLPAGNYEAQVFTGSGQSESVSFTLPPGGNEELVFKFVVKEFVSGEG